MCLCLCVINHCLTLYRTHNARAPFSPLKINSSSSDVLTIAGQENDSVTYSAAVRVVHVWCFTGERGAESGNLSKKKKNVAGGRPRVSIEKGMGTHTQTHTYTHTNIRAKS